MKLLLAQKTVYVPTHGGENKANRLLLEGLAERGHTCRAIAPAYGAQGPGARTEFLEALAARSLTLDSSTAGLDVFSDRGVEVHAAADNAALTRELERQIADFQPALVLVSSEDPGQALLEGALKAGARVVYLAHTMLFFPCGPNSFFVNPAATALLKQTAGIVTVSEYLKKYLRRWADCDSAVIPFPVYGKGPFPRFGDTARGSVTLINPCAYKGLPIFLELARRRPHVRFLGVASWGTTRADRVALGTLPNVRVIESADDIDRIFAWTRLLIVPSLWEEGFPLVPIEAMLRGIPVLASDTGGLPEAKLGVDYVIPVARITRYGPGFDDRNLPIADVPSQDVEPWLAALDRLTADPGHYAQLAAASRAAADAYVRRLSVAPFEDYFESLCGTPAPARMTSSPGSRLSEDKSKQALLAAVERLSPERRRLLAMRLDSVARVQTIPRRPREAGINIRPASLAQERLWFLDRWAPGNVSYNNIDAFRLRGRLDREALRQSLDEMVRRHETLRTTFREEDGRPMQVIAPALSVSIEEVDAPGDSAGEREQGLTALITAEGQKPFDLAAGPLIRCVLVTLGDDDHVLLLTTHHIISDGWSGGVMFRELAALYGAFGARHPASLPALPIQYADFAEWQHEAFQRDGFASDLEYWKGRLAGAPGVLDLPGDRPRPAARTFNGARQAIVLDAGLSAELRALSERHGVTLFMALLSAFAALLHRLTGQTDIVIGSPVAGRSQRETENLVGFFVNTIALRVDLSGDPTFAELLRRVYDVAVSAYAHQTVPFAKVVEQAQPDRAAGHNPVFQVMLVLQDGGRPRLALEGLALEPLDVDTGTAKVDLTLDVTEQDRGLSCTFEYTADLFDPPTISRWLGHWTTLLASAVRDSAQHVSRLDLLTASERRQILVDWNSTARHYGGDHRLDRLFDLQVERTPEATALTFEDQHLSYRELNRRANQLAFHLRALGVKPDVLVGLCLERSIEMVVAILGTLKAGGAYVPLDPEYPRERLAFMLEDSAVHVLVTHAQVQVLPSFDGHVISLDANGGGLPGNGTLEPAELGPEHLAYVIYTSGSTGRPKGAMNTHAGVCNRLLWIQEEYPLRAGDSLLQKTPFSFDVSVPEFLWPLMAGARLVVAPPGVHRDPRALAMLMRQQQITTTHFVPSMLHAFLEEAGQDALPDLRRVMCSGEALSVELARRFFEWSSAELHNLYGPTEAAIEVTHWACEPDGCRITVPIGRPIANTQIHVLDPFLNPVPIGIDGELHIGGVGLARGYWNRPELTKERFVVNPFSSDPASRLYKTGDRARYLPDGTLEYRGRLDQQVKVRGFRIELGEIEAALTSHPAVREAAVIVHEPRSLDKELVAYIVPRDGLGPGLAETLRSALSKTLPDYMIPARVVTIGALPLMPSGKLDRAALPLPGPNRTAAQAPVKPKTPTETRLAEIWVDLLSLEHIGSNDNFFTLGGHSLLAARILSRVRRAFGVDVPLRSMFDTPTIAGLAAAIDSAASAGAGLAEPAMIRLPRRSIRDSASPPRTA